MLDSLLQEIYTYISGGLCHEKRKDADLDRSQSVFYFVPQDSHSQAGSTYRSVTVSPAMASCCCCNISQCFHTMTLDEYWKDYWADYSSEQTGNKLILKNQSKQAKAEINCQADLHMEEEISKLEDQHLVYVQRQDRQHKTNMTKVVAKQKKEMKERDDHYKAETNELNDQHAVVIKTRDDQHDADVVRLVGFHEVKGKEQDDEHEADIKTKVCWQTTEVIKLVAQYNEEIRKREAEIKELRDQLAIEIKKKALCRRDGFNPSSPLPLIFLHERS